MAVWGIPATEVICEKEKSITLPPIIAEDKQCNAHVRKEQNTTRVIRYVLAQNGIFN